MFQLISMKRVHSPFYIYLQLNPLNFSFGKGNEETLCRDLGVSDLFLEMGEENDVT